MARKATMESIVQQELNDSVLSAFVSMMSLPLTYGNTEQWRYRRRFGVRGIICDIGVADKGSVSSESGVVARFPCVVFGIKTESGCDQARDWTSRVFLTITRLARANKVCSCAVFLAKEARPS